MNRFRSELKLIPAGAWITAIIVCGAMVFGLLFFLLHAKDFPGPFAITLVAPPVVIFVFILLTGYVYGDARRRGMRYVVWTLLAIFIPNGLGILLYFLLREPLQHPCPLCGTPRRTAFNYCAGCGAAAAPTCGQCNLAVEQGWNNCVHCGASLPGGHAAGTIS